MMCGYFIASLLERETKELLVSLFLLGILQLTGAKYQAFAYNLRTVRSSFMKFGQKFQINKMFVLIKFWGNRFCDFGFRARKSPQKFGAKTGLIQKRL